MESVHSINLFRRSVTYSPFLAVIDRYLVMIRYILLGAVVLVGAVTLSVYLYTSRGVARLTVERARLLASITQNKEKESMLMALRARINSLSKILKNQISIAPYIDTTLTLAHPPVLTSFSLGTGNTVQISLTIPTIDDAVTIVGAIITMNAEKKISNPILTSLALDKSGKVVMGLTYAVMLEKQ